MAQTAHPFAAPVSSAALSMSAAAAVADLNRDGSPDVVVPGLFYGTMITALDEDGNALALNGPGPGINPIAGGSLLPRALAMACGPIDHDDREDLVVVTSCGTLHYFRNLGSTLLATSSFTPDVVIDNFQSRFPVNPPFVHYSFPCLQVVDVDLDGHQDILIAGGPIDRWAGCTRPGFVSVYKGDGSGHFTSVRRQLPGSAIDAEFADLDNNGTPDHVVVLMETGSVGAFSYEILHFALANNRLVPTTFPQTVGPGKLTALEFADVIGDANKDYILAHTTTNGGTIASQLYYFQGDGLGNVNSSQWGMFVLPPNLTTLGDFISSVKVGDWNRDTHTDLAILRGYVQPSPASSAAPALYGDSDVLVAMGPSLAWAQFETIALPGHHNYSSSHTQHFSLLPLFSESECLRVIDLARDSNPDLLIPGLRSSGPTGGTMVATLKNLTASQTGDARFEKVGAPSGGAPARPARIGFEGGRPRPGNANFAATILNVQGGSLVGLMWGPVAIANLFSAYGYQFHVAPAEFCYASVASGSQPGQGFHSHPLPIPNVPALVGDAGYFQWNYFDPATGTFGGTQATGVWIGN